MPITDVELTDTFDSWRIKTNQIIQQSNQAFNISISSFEYSNNALNNVVIIASNVTANIVSQNTYLIGAVSNNVIVAVNQNVENIIVSNTLIKTSITNSANAYALLFFSTNSLGQTWTTANYAYIHANAAHVHANAAFDKANTGGTISYQAYDQANTANITADAAYNQANAARIHANSGFDTANAANQYAFAAIIQANTGRDHANASFGRANAALSNAAIGVANNYAYTGNLYVISNFYVPTANVVLGRLSDSTVGQGVKLDIAGAANASQYYISGNMVTAMTNSYTQLVGAASNTWSNTIFGYSNTKFMVNTTATFAGSLTTTGTISDA